MEGSERDEQSGAQRDERTRSKVNLDELFRGVRPIRSVDDLAAPEVFESDEELEEFLAAVRADRDADLA